MGALIFLIKKIGCRGTWSRSSLDQYNVIHRYAMIFYHAKKCIDTMVKLDSLHGDSHFSSLEDCSSL